MLDLIVKIALLRPKVDHLVTDGKMIACGTTLKTFPAGWHWHLHKLLNS
jgi:hypothetical protein